MLAHLVLLLATAAQVKDSTRLEDLVVTATRTPRRHATIGSSADVFRPAELSRRQIGSLREALQLAPGGTVLMSGGPGATTSLFLRGTASTQALFLVDGMRVNDANIGFATFLGGADLAGLGQLEIVRGPQSTLYGGAAIGGVVSLEAAEGAGSPSGSVEVEGGSFDTWSGRAVAQARRGSLGVSAAVTVNGTDNQRQPNDWDQRTQLVRLDYRIGSRVDVGGTFRGMQHSYTSPGDLRSSNSTPEGTTTFDNALATLRIEARPTDRWRSRLLAGAQEQYSKGTARFDGGDEFVFVLDNSRRVLDWQNTVALSSRATLIAGFNREWNTVTTDGASLDERLYAGYAVATLDPFDALSLTGGIRGDNYNTFTGAVTWRVTAAWRLPRSGTKLRASYGTGFMPPSLAARFGSVFQDPNPNIRPERSRGWDAGVDQEIAGGRAAFSMTWFHNSLRDLIAFEGADFPDKGRNINVDRARTRGLETSGRVVAGRVEARLAWTLLSAVSLSEPDPELSRLIRRPRHTLNGDLSIDLGGDALIGAGALLVADREDSDFNAFPTARIDPGDYALVRLYGSVPVARGVRLNGRVENLFDRTYEPVYGFPGLGRSVVVGGALSF